MRVEGQHYVTTSCGEVVWDAKRAFHGVSNRYLSQGKVIQGFSRVRICECASEGVPGHGDVLLMESSVQDPSGDHWRGMTLVPESVVDNSGLLGDMSTACQFGWTDADCKV